MTSEKIKAKYERLMERLRTHDANRKIIEGEIKAIQHICQHPNKKNYKSYDYGGGCDLHTAENGESICRIAQARCICHRTPKRLTSSTTYTS